MLGFVILLGLDDILPNLKAYCPICIYNNWPSLNTQFQSYIIKIIFLYQPFLRLLMSSKLTTIPIIPILLSSKLDKKGIIVFNSRDFFIIYVDEFKAMRYFHFKNCITNPKMVQNFKNKKIKMDLKIT